MQEPTGILVSEAPAEESDWLVAGPATDRGSALALALVDADQDPAAVASVVSVLSEPYSPADLPHTARSLHRKVTPQIPPVTADLRRPVQHEMQAMVHITDSEPGLFCCNRRAAGHGTPSTKERTLELYERATRRNRATPQRVPPFLDHLIA
jgi:hypothetical protein